MYQSTAFGISAKENSTAQSVEKNTGRRNTYKSTGEFLARSSERWRRSMSMGHQGSRPWRNNEYNEKKGRIESSSLLHYCSPHHRRFSPSKGAKYTVLVHNAIMNDTVDCGPKSALSLLEEERSNPKLCLIEHPSFPLNLGLTELAGPAGSGKTQICLSTLVSYIFFKFPLFHLMVIDYFDECLWKLIPCFIFRFWIDRWSIPRLTVSGERKRLSIYP